MEQAATATVAVNNNKDGAGSSTSEDLIDLPPGFRFHPTDEEIITHYLTEKVMNPSFAACAIAEVDLNKSEPWDLPRKAKMGEKEYYFFCQRDRKYPTGMRTNRATEAGYWKATGKDKEIYKGRNCLVGMKKTLVFYKGRAPKGEKTNWVMHEYRLEGKFSYYSLPKPAKDEWVVCRVFHKNTGLKKPIAPGILRINSFGDDFFMDYSSQLPPLMDSTPHPNNYSIDANTSQANEFKSRPPYNSQGNYFPPIQTNIDPNQNLNQNLFFYPQNNFQNQIPTHHQNPISPYQTTPVNNNNCKAEQFSSTQSMVSRSQDTGLSTDINATAEISSSINVSNKQNYDDLEGPIADFNSFWNTDSPSSIFQLH